MGTNAHIVLAVAHGSGSAAPEAAAAVQAASEPAWQRDSFWVAPSAHLLLRSAALGAMPGGSGRKYAPRALARLPPFATCLTLSTLNGNNKRLAYDHSMA